MTTTEQTNVTTETQTCLIRIGRTGSKTHRGEVTIQTIDAGKPWQRKKIVSVICHCQMTGGVGRLASKAIALLGTDSSEATCEWCKEKK